MYSGRRILKDPLRGPADTMAARPLEELERMTTAVPLLVS